MTNIAVGGPYVSRDLIYGGDYKLAGMVTELGVPGRYRVKLLLKEGNAQIRGTWSNSTTGAYQFSYLKNTPDDWYLLVFDNDTPTPKVGDMIDRGITMELMP